MISSGWNKFVVLFCLILTSVVSLPRSLLAGESTIQNDDAVPYVLTISGGVSLGAYEAGLNWALTKYLKLSRQSNNDTNQSLPPKLVTVTGASAGSINGLLTAISWCVDTSKLTENSDYHETVTDNLFKDIWVDVGLDGLLPKDQKNYLSTDGLLSRAPFTKPLDKIRKLMSEKIFFPGCTLPLGITVTDEAVKTIQIAGITVNNQRDFIPLLFKSDEQGGAAFYAYPVDQSDPDFGNVIYLPPKQEPKSNLKTIHYQIDINQVIKAVLASSAFPVAFGRVRLDYCSPPALDGSPGIPDPNAKFQCPGRYAPQSAVFIDGGVFDNIPLGSAKALAEERMKNTARRINYIFMDPDNRRGKQNTVEPPSIAMDKSSSDKEQPSSENYNLIDQLKFIGGAVLTARNYELYKVLTNGDWTNQSFYYVDLLNKLIDAKLQGENTSLNSTPSYDCDVFYKSLTLNNSRQIDPQWLKQAKYCINQESTALDYRYQYQPATTNELQTQRNTLIDHLAIIAKRVKGNRLSRLVEQTKNDDLGDRRILLSSRYFPLTGSYLGAFGAFFDRPFRQFDYYVGVYDGIHDIASHACRFRKVKNNGDSNCQIGAIVNKLYTKFNVNNDPNARFMFSHIAKQEHPDYTEQKSSWHWLTNLENETANKQLSVIFTALNDGYDEDNNLKSPDFDDFILKLKETGYSTANSSEYFKYIVNKDKDWWVLPSIRISDRLYTLEEDSEKESEEKSLLKRPLALVSYVTHHFDTGGKLITFAQPSSAPSQSPLRWLPYEIGIRANHDHTPYLSWEPTLNILGREMLRFKITPVQLESQKEHSDKLYQISFMHNFLESNDYNFGAAIDINGAWQKRDTYDRVTTGLSVNMEIKKRVRVTFGFYDIYDHFTDYNYYLNVGLTDIAGYFH